MNIIEKYFLFFRNLCPTFDSEVCFKSGLFPFILNFESYQVRLFYLLIICVINLEVPSDKNTIDRVFFKLKNYHRYFEERHCTNTSKLSEPNLCT